jgi:hypothetical protein
MRVPQRILNIRPAEFSRVLLLGLGWASVTGFTVAGKAARDAFFLSRYDKSYLPLMFVAVAAAVAITVAVLSRIGKSRGPRQILGLAAALIAASLMPSRDSKDGWSRCSTWIEVASVILAEF